MLIFKYFYDNQMVYRDLKPDNIMIDENKELVLIDLDSLIKIDECKTSENTLDIGYIFIAPEVEETKKFSYQSDVYSLGKIIEYIMKNIVMDASQNEYLAVNEIISKCININAENRSSISDIIHYFISIFHGQSKLEKYNNKYDIHFKYFEKIITTIKKYKINKNDPKVQLDLGYIYYEGKYVDQNIDKAINYLSLAAKQNDSISQFKLGVIYEEGKYIKQDINKAIHYYSLAADKNHPMAVYYLGLIYEEGKYLISNINKAISYYLRAANLNNPKAQFKLGYFYYAGKYLNNDITKAIHYYSLAADQNYTNAQLCLGAVYYLDNYAQHNLEKLKIDAISTSNITSLYTRN